MSAEILIDELKINKFELMGIEFHNCTLNEALDQCERFIQEKTPHMVFTPTAELIVRANEDADLKKIYNNSHLLTIDSFVVYYAAKLLFKPVREPVSAARLMFDFLNVAHRKGYRMYLLGAKEEVLNKTIQNLELQYPGINIAGSHNGYFNNDQPVVEDIVKKSPDVLFVAMSSPLKENFISKNLHEMQVPVCIGVGGSFDIIAGKCSLAPEWISKLGFEWFYRFSQEPRRLWKRYLSTNTKFLWLCAKELYKQRSYL